MNDIFGGNNAGQNAQQMPNNFPPQSDGFGDF